MGDRRDRGLPPRQQQTAAEAMADMKRRLVELANINDAAMDGTTEPVLEIIAQYHVVYGVWQDPIEPVGVGRLIIRGGNRLREIAARGGSQECLH